MVIRQIRIQFVFRCLAAMALLPVLAGCDRHAAELATLKSENERLKTELAKLRQGSDGAKEPGAAAGKPDLTLTLIELWTQRFEENEFRAQQRLAGKLMRVTGTLDEVASDRLSLHEPGQARNVRMTINLEKQYAARVQQGLGALEKGAMLTVQGKFSYDRMELSDATIVDKTSGAPMTTQQLQAFVQLGSGAPPPPPPKGQ